MLITALGHNKWSLDADHGSGPKHGSLGAPAAGAGYDISLRDESPKSAETKAYYGI